MISLALDLLGAYWLASKKRSWGWCLLLGAVSALVGAFLAYTFFSSTPQDVIIRVTVGPVIHSGISLLGFWLFSRGEQKPQAKTAVASEVSTDELLNRVRGNIERDGKLDQYPGFKS